MSYDKKHDYLVFHFYIPDYNLQGTPIPIPMRYFEDEGYRKTVLEARDRFYSHLSGSTENIHPAHKRLWSEGRVRYTVQRRSLRESIAHYFNNNIRILRKRETAEMRARAST